MAVYCFTEHLSLSLGRDPTLHVMPTIRGGKWEVLLELHMDCSQDSLHSFLPLKQNWFNVCMYLEQNRNWKKTLPCNICWPSLPVKNKSPHRAQEISRGLHVQTDILDLSTISQKYLFIHLFIYILTYFNAISNSAHTEKTLNLWPKWKQEMMFHWSLPLNLAVALNRIKSIHSAF